MIIKRFKKRESGSAAIEFIIVILPCLILMFLFLNILMIVGNLMLTQSVANRTVQQVAAYGCLPTDLKDIIERDQNYIGTSDVKINVYRSSEPWSAGSWKSQFKEEVDCANARAIQERFVFVEINYNQDVVLIPGVTSLNLKTSALSIASNLEQ